MYWLAARRVRRRRSSPTRSSGRSSPARSQRPATRARRGEPTASRSLYAYLIAPVWWLHSTASPTPRSSTSTRRDGDRRGARLPAGPAAGLGPCRAASPPSGRSAPPPSSTPRSLLPEVLAYPTFCLCAYASVRALSGGGRRWTAAAIVARRSSRSAVRRELDRAPASRSRSRPRCSGSPARAAVACERAGVAGTTSERPPSASAR